MLKNNLKAFFFHIALSLIGFVSYIMLIKQTGIVDWATNKAYEIHMLKMMVLSIMILLGVSFLYYAFASRFLEPQGSVFKNLLSVSCVSIIGVLFWLTIYPLSQLDPWQHSNIWSLHSIYIGFTTMLISEVDWMESVVPTVLLIGSFLPSLIMGLAIKKKT